MEITRTFLPADRYRFDCGECSSAAGFAQVDTRQDASYFGQWANPTARKLVSYCEGDVTRTECADDAEFVQTVREMETWTNDAGYGPLKIDPGFNEDLTREFTRLGLADLLH